MERRCAKWNGTGGRASGGRDPKNPELMTAGVVAAVVEAESTGEPAAVEEENITPARRVPVVWEARAKVVLTASRPAMPKREAVVSEKMAAEDMEMRSA